ncbi:YolD-like family protein [Paenibacillus puerhi]|uniref:YolD-like family protein n=1 Tax=Paenibacillus puerhi TaxID=2692622 RepID=UPI001F1EB991|nr:YolD-like family protein [Paenibacillus puerhi]
MAMQAEGGVPKPGKKYGLKRPTRDEFELEELGNQLVEAKQEESEVELTIWGADPVRGRISELDARTRMVHVSHRYGDVVKVPFLDVMKVDYPR